MLKLRFEKYTSSTGKEYLIKTNRKHVRIRDYKELTLNAKLYPMILRELIAKPKGLKVDDFDSFRELQEVCEVAVRLSGVNRR